MRVLFIAPLPPPITGHSLVSKVLYAALRNTDDVSAVDLGVASRHDGTVTVRRIWEVVKAFAVIRRRVREANVIYLTIAESLAGNAKDLAIYCVCFRHLHKMVLHLHGGTIGRELFERFPIVKAVNALFIRRMGGVIVSGRSHQSIFSAMIDAGRLHTIPNFAQDFLFLREEAVEEKFAQTSPLRVLYISAMTKAKGYRDLLDGYSSLDEQSRSRIRIDFAGAFDTDSEKTAFLASIREHSGLAYHGIVDEQAKRQLFSQAHLFCLPTTMLEGQPVSILEAYASGCAVMTTGQRGIRDIFSSGSNGFEIAERDPSSIREKLHLALSNIDALRRFALSNRRDAEKHYTVANFTTSVRDALLANAGAADTLRATRRNDG
jgi:glycosyltransferase involved in cell wall biosynthesis